MSTPSSTPPHGAASRPATPPYAFPLAGSAPADLGLNAGRVIVGPYVPAPWRGKPAVERVSTPLAVASIPASETDVGEMPPAYPTPAYFTPLGTLAQDDFVTPAFDLPAIVDVTEGLPWIESFLSSTPALPMQAVEEPAAMYTPPTSHAIVEEAVAAQWPLAEVVPEAPTPSDAWALDEAAERMRALAEDLRNHDGIAGDASEPSRLFDDSPSPEPLPAWSDDDLIDIMPVQQERTAAPVRAPTPGATSAIEPWADRARRVGDENAEAAARALELLARRVRDGEISLAGYEPRLGDAAALAAALAALLGVRR